MKYRAFGRTGWQVSEIGFGGARIGGLLAQDGGRVGAMRTLAAAADAGINFYDTADMYAQGESEALVGLAFRNSREKVLIATKGGYCLPAKKKLFQLVKPFAKPIAKALGLKRAVVPSSAAGPIPQDFSPTYLRAAVDASLRRLQSDYIDLYQLHSPSGAFLASPQFDEALDSLAQIKAQGKIREYGVALDQVDDARHCLDREGIASLQLPFGLLDMEAMDGSFEEISQRRIGIISRGCFGGGGLKASLSTEELRAVEPKWERVLRIREIVGHYGRSPLEAALQFSLLEARIGVTILGMRTPEHVSTNLQHYCARSLSSEELQRLLAHNAAAPDKPHRPI